MAVQYSTSVRNNWLDSIEATIGVSPTLEIRTGSPPANASSGDSGSLLVSIALPSDYLAAASGGSKILAGTWTGTASGTGSAGHFRIKQTGTTHIQGTVTGSGGGGDITLDNISIAAGQVVSIASFTLSATGA